MFRPSALRGLLSQVTTGNINATILANKSGEYLDYVIKDNNPNINIKNICAIICSIYQSFLKMSVPLQDQLNYLIVDCDAYRLAIQPVGSHLVCVCADSNTGLGIIKLKLNSLSSSLSSLINFTAYSTS
jgi:predicted regulator of Ras-like GTPase activity (Roadblock/LC7/MglB family)